MGLLDLVAANTCVCCGSEGIEPVCRTCAGRMEPLDGPICGRCGAPAETADVAADGRSCALCDGLLSLGRARSLLVFGGRASPARATVLALKRRGPRALARDMGVLLGDLVAAHELARDAVAFVPGGARRDAAGFDHAQLLARSTAAELGVRLVRVLSRVGLAGRQSEVPAELRAQNAAGSFSARPVAGRLLLVDDVFTTGATADACSAALREAGAEAVDVVTWARAVKAVPKAAPRGPIYSSR